MPTLGHAARTLTLILLVALPLDADAQDLFGRAVAVAGDALIVVKPGTSRGGAAVLIYERDGRGGWREAHRLTPIDGAPGEGLGPSIAVGGATLAVAAADPDVLWGAHVYRRTGSGWQASGRIPLVAGAADRPQAALDLDRIMRLASPPARAVAVSPDGDRIATARTGVGGSGELVVARASRDGWTEEARIRAVENDAAGVVQALALGRDRLVIGVGQPARTGFVLVYARANDGVWSRVARLDAPASLGAQSGFGMSVAFDGAAVLVGAPQADAVAVYAQDAAGGWANTQLLQPGSAAAGSFGVAIAAHANTLWVGAPAANGGRGIVHRFQRSAPAGPWQSAGSITHDDIDGPALLGLAVALGENLAVAGAAQANGGHGEAGVWVRDNGAWSEAGTLEPGHALEEVSSGEIRCADGQASRFDCRSVDLLAFLPIEAIGGEPGEHVSDLWGWTDPQTKREYALVGRNGGVAIVDVTSPSAPRYMGVLPGNRAGPRDIKIYRDHLFFVGDGAGAHGLLIFDLTRLRSGGDAPATFTPDARYDGIASAHNLVMDAESGTAIPVGASGGGNTCGGGLHMIDVREPKKPQFAGCYTDTEGLITPGRTHDAQCVVYRGPDARHQNRQICFVANETALRIVDITDKSNPTPISRASYPSRAYIHQGWLTEDQRYFYMNDEIDELVGLAERTRTLIWDVADLEDPILAGEYFGPDAATDHNLYIRGNLMYLANYQAGLRVVDITDPLNPVEIGFFDTTPYEGNPPGWVGGAWTAFPFLESGTVLVSSINEGLFVLRPVRPIS